MRYPNKLIEKIRRKSFVRPKKNAKFVVIIVNNIPPYSYEINNFLGLPTGFCYRFRYQKKWFPEIDDPLEIEGHDGLIVLRDFNSGRLIPLRKIHIFDVRKVGDIYYIEYSLGDIVEKLPERFDQLLESYLKSDKYPNQPNEDLVNLIFFSVDFSDSLITKQPQLPKSEREFRNWGNLVKILGEMECYREFDFLKVIRITDEKRKDAPLKSLTPNMMGYKLFSDKTYHLEVFQRTYTGKKGDSAVNLPRDVWLITEPGVVKQIRPKQSVIGKYDLLTFSFKTEVLSSGKNSFLEMRYGEKDLIHGKYSMPPINMPVQISFSSMSKVLGIVKAIFFIGSSLLFLFSWTVSELLKMQFLNTSDFRNVMILIMILTASGAKDIGTSILSRIRFLYEEHKK